MKIRLIVKKYSILKSPFGDVNDASIGGFPEKSRGKWIIEGILLFFDENSFLGTISLFGSCNLLQTCGCFSRHIPVLESHNSLGHFVAQESFFISFFLSV
jgi:hypothetical protein